MSTTFSFGSAPLELTTPVVTELPSQLLQELARKIEQRTMMLFGVERQSHLKSILLTRARLKTNGDVHAYAQSVLTLAGELEFMSLIDDLTINETTFFRNVPQMNLFS